MKLLFDQNLAPRLVTDLADVFPGSAHLSRLDLGEAGDDKVWEFALDHGFTIVSKDTDFNNLSVMRGSPPKVIWLRMGNCSTTVIEALLRTRYDELIKFRSQASEGVLAIR